MSDVDVMLQEFRIIVNDMPPGQIFHPGYEVTGTVILELSNPQSYQFIQIGLFGKARVSTEEIANRGSIKHGRFHGATQSLLPANAFTEDREYVNRIKIVWNKEDSPEGQLPSGRHEFPFRLPLPPNVPSSFKGPLGDVRYYLEAGIHNFGLEFEVVSTEINVSEFTEIPRRELKPVKMAAEKDGCCIFCYLSAPIMMAAELPRTGFSVGEPILLHVTLENLSRLPVSISAILLQRATYEVRGKVCSSLGTVMDVRSDPVLPGTTLSWSFPDEVKLPLALTPTSPFPSPRNRVIFVSYVLAVSVIVPWSNNLSVNIPISIGNQPSPVTVE